MMSQTPSQRALAESVQSRRIPDEVRIAIRKRRLETGKSFRELAYEFGVSKSAVEEICNEDAASILERAKKAQASKSD